MKAESVQKREGVSSFLDMDNLIQAGCFLGDGVHLSQEGETKLSQRFIRWIRTTHLLVQGRRMFRIAALNSSLSGSEADGEDEAIGKGNSGPSREVLESTAHSNHSAAIQHMALTQDGKAEECFLAVLANPYVANAAPSSESGKLRGHHLTPELSLKYSCYKNLANIHMKRKSYQAASDYYLQAMELDASEVGVCYRLGMVATQLRDFDLALVAFQEGLKTSPHHLICLDQLLSVLLVLGMHVEVLAVAITVLRRHPGHTKARAFTDYILRVLPHCARTVRHLYKHSEVLFTTHVDYDRAAGDKYIATCLALRPPITGPPEVTDTNTRPVVLPLAAKLESLTWQHLGRSLMATLELVETQSPVMLTAPVMLDESLKEYEKSQCTKLEAKSMSDAVNAAHKNAEGNLRPSQNMKTANEKNNSSSAHLAENDQNSASVAKSLCRRRTTIEAGNGQHTFRMDDRSSTDESSCPPAKQSPRPDNVDDPVLKEERAEPASGKVPLFSVSDKSSSLPRIISANECGTEIVIGKRVDGTTDSEGDRVETNVESESPSLFPREKVQESKIAVSEIKSETGEKPSNFTMDFNTLCSPTSVEHSLHDGKRVEVNLFPDFDMDRDIKTELHVDRKTVLHETEKESSKRKLQGEGEPETVPCKKARTGSTEEELSSGSLTSTSAGRRTSTEADDATIFKEPIKRTVARKSSCESDESECRNENEEDASSSLKNGSRRSTESSEMTGEDLDTENTDSSGSEGVDEEEDLEGSGTQGSDDDEEEDDEINEDDVDDEEDESQIEERGQESGEEMNVDGDEPEAELDEDHQEARDSENEVAEDEELEDSAMDDDHSQTQDPEDLDGMEVADDEGDQNEEIALPDEPCDLQLLNNQIHAACQETDDAQSCKEIAAFEVEADRRSQCSDGRADNFEMTEDDDDERDKCEDDFVDDGRGIEEASETLEDIEDQGASQLACANPPSKHSTTSGSPEVQLSTQQLTESQEDNEPAFSHAGAGNIEVNGTGADDQIEGEGAELSSSPGAEVDAEVYEHEGLGKAGTEKFMDLIASEDGSKKESCAEVMENFKCEKMDRIKQKENSGNEIGSVQFREPPKRDVSKEGNQSRNSSWSKENNITNDEHKKSESHPSQSVIEGDVGQQLQTTMVAEVLDKIDANPGLSTSMAAEASHKNGDVGQELSTLIVAEKPSKESGQELTSIAIEVPRKERGADEDDATDAGETEPPESATDVDDEMDQRNLNSAPTTPRGRGRPCRKRRALMNNVLQSPIVGRPLRKSGPRRGKRGLERELQQLDHWGRKADGGASKRRRRVGQDGITTAHLLRSFVPATLLGTNAETHSEAMDESVPEDEVIPASSSAPPAQAGVMTCTAGDVSKVPCSSSAESATTSSAAVVAASSSSAVASANFPPAASQNVNVIRNHVDRSLVEPASNIPRQEKSATEAISSALPAATAVTVTSAAGGRQKQPLAAATVTVPEEDKVRQFLVEHSKNHGLLELLGRFLSAMVSSHSSSLWSASNARTYLGLYPRHRETIDLQSPLCMSPELIPELELHCKLALAYWELSVSAASKTPLPEKFRDDDLMQLSLLLTRPEIVSQVAMYKQRFSWLMGQVQLLDGRPDSAALHLSQVVDECEDLGVSELCCHRVEGDVKKVTPTRARSLLKSLLRRQLVRQVEEQFRQQHYTVVVEVVSGELVDDGSFADADQRSSHCTMLMTALVATADYKGVLEWGSLVLQQELAKGKSDAVDADANIDDGDDEDLDKGFDFKLLGLVLQSMEEAMTRLHDDVSSVSKSALVRLVEGLIGVLVLQLEQVYDCSNCGPWLLLHKLLLQQELQSATPRPLPSTLFLVTAHEEISKLEKCCCDDGRLLLYSLPVLLEELQHEMPTAACTSLLQARDQATHCLYHLPSRRNKRGVRDHASEGIPLTLQQAQRLYPFYRPSELPQFQAATPPSLSEDTAALFRRFIDLLPPDLSVDGKVDEINKYMSGETNELNLVTPASAHPLPDVFYLLGDHFFKNKEWDSAVLYYKQDLVISPTRLDSWAGVSLALKTQLETKLNSCDVIDDEEAFLRQVEATRRGFEQALKQDLNHSNLWVEFGGLVYMTFSHASRLLKQELNPDMSLEMYGLLERTKVKMLAKAEQCFDRALQLSLAEEEPDEERWLYYYMLGKIGEKKSSPCREVIELYIAAANELHINAAQYPPKISYNNPEEFAVEALEMYFRVHSYIIKYLELKDSKSVTSEIMDYFVTVTEELSKGNFVTVSQYNFKDASFIPSINGRSSPSPHMIQTVAFAQSLVSEMVENAFNEIESKNKQREIMKDESKDVERTDPSVGVCSDDEIMVLEETKEQKQKKIVVSRCLDAFKLCLTRFPHHYKSLYRLAHYYHSTKLNKDNNKTRNYLIGSYFWQRAEYMPVNGLFHERKISYQQPRSCNLFHGVWRIPNDEIDRPGSFAAHMYRCVSLALDVLPTVRDFQTTFDIALALKVTPEKDKKYLRENERQLLCEHATQVGLQAVKDKFRILFKTNAVIHRNRKMTFLSDLYGCHRYLSRHLGAIESTVSSLLGQTFAALESVSGEPSTLVRQAEAYCQAHKMAGHSSRRSAQQRSNALPPRVKRPTTALLLHQQQQMLKHSAVEPVKTADNISDHLPSQTAQEMNTANSRINFNSKDHSQLPPPSTVPASTAKTSASATSASTMASVSTTAQSTTALVQAPSTEQNVSAPRFSANSHPRSLATPQPRSNAAPVPRSSATPVPRSSASPSLRRQSNPPGRKVPAVSSSTKEPYLPAQSKTLSSSSPNSKHSSTSSFSRVAAANSTSRTSKSPTGPVSGTNEELIHRAYGIYEKLIQSQTRLNTKGIDAKSYGMHKAQLDSYQAQLLQYLKVPVVSQYFQQSLQKMQNTAAKLPAPPPPSKDTVQASTTAPPSSVSIKSAPTSSHANSSNDIIVEKCIRKNVPSNTKQVPNKVGGQLPVSISTSNVNHSKSVSTTSPSGEVSGRSVPQKRNPALQSNNTSKPLPRLPKGLSVTVSPSKESVPSRLIPPLNKSISLNPIRPAALGTKASTGPSSARQTQTGNCVQLNPQQLMQLAYGSSPGSGFASTSTAHTRNPNKSVTVANKSLQSVKRTTLAKPKSLTVAEKLQRLRAQPTTGVKVSKPKDPLERCSSQADDDIITLD
ncbi:Tetratricopeptide-like helical domain [Trinorchestia longiramus]|nr:Tetratricopeptide-like helical domain [Trinorchestia longiramus]